MANGDKSGVSRPNAISFSFAFAFHSNSVRYSLLRLGTYRWVNEKMRVQRATLFSFHIVAKLQMIITMP